MARAIANLEYGDDGKMRARTHLRRGEIVSYIIDPDDVGIAERHYGDDVIIEFHPADQFARIVEVPDLATGLLVSVREGAEV